MDAAAELFSVRSPSQRSTWLSQDELVGGEVHVEARVGVEPAGDGRGLVGGQVVANQVGDRARRAPQQ